MNEKRYRTEQIQGATLPFIVDNYSAKKHKTMTGYKAYSTTTVKKCDELTDLLNNYEKENEQLQSELSGYKEVNRLDIWKSSYSSEDALITELQDKCDKKQEHIVVLENKIRRMREAIHKLEWLASHRNADLMRENWQLKSEKQVIIDILNEMEKGDDFWDRDYLIDRISDIETAIGVDLDD